MCPSRYSRMSTAELLAEIVMSPEFAVRYATARAGTPAKNDGKPREWFRFVTNKADPKKAEIHLYGDIGETFFGEGVSAEDFVAQLDAIDATELSIRINSPGGSAWDGLTIANAIIRHPATVTCYIDGLAASAASVVAVAGDEVVASKYSQAMVHGASAVVLGGNSKELREIAAQMDGIDTSMASYYADRAGGTPADWSRAMAKETWYNADEMLAAGLATSIDTSAVRDEVEKAAASAMAGTAETYKYQGRTAAPAPTVRATNHTKESRMADKKSLAESLGLPEDATEADIIAATQKALGVETDPKKTDDKPADPPVVTGGDPAPVADPAPADPALTPAAKAADGTVTVDAATFAQMQQQLAQGVAAHKTLTAQADAKVVDAAIDAGKITPARRNHYMALMASDRADTADLLQNRLAAGASVPLTEIGHSADATPSASVTENPAYQAWKVG